nr:G protein-coupled receptor [Proales similis]
MMFQSLLLYCLCIQTASSYLGIRKSEVEAIPKINCNLYLDSKGTEPLAESDMKRINETADKCALHPMTLVYFRAGYFQAKGESLSDLNEAIKPLVNRANFTQISLFIFGARGLAIDFRIPILRSSSDISVLFGFFHFALLNEAGNLWDKCSPISHHNPTFKSEQYLQIIFSRGVRYFEETCPWMFIEALIRRLAFYDLVDSRVKRNNLSFKAINETFNSTVLQLYLFGYQIGFGPKLFCPVLFQKTNRLLFCGVLSDFRPEVLKNSSFKLIQLFVSRLRAFLHNNPNWLSCANERKAQDMLVVEYGLTKDRADSNFANKNYLSWLERVKSNPFDDSSFCLFYRIELNSLDIKFKGRVIEKLAQENCSCLLFWVVSRYWAHNHSSSAKYYSDLGLCVRDQIKLKKQCEYGKMAQRCSIETTNRLDYGTKYNTIIDLQFTKYLADIWMTPLTSVLGIIANILVIRTFRKIKRSPEYRRNKLTDKGRFMWEYTYYNSWFILFHGLLFACGPISTCIEFNGIYCSQLVLTRYYQVFYLFVESFLGNTLRLAANMSSTLFVLYRYGLNTDRLASFRRVRPHVLTAFLVLVSAFISVITLFVNERFTIYFLKENAYFYMISQNSLELNRSQLLKVPYLLNTFMGTILFPLLNMLIDLKLLSLLRRQNADRPKEEAEKRITKMVILNGLFSFFFRLPEMISASFLLAFTLDPDFFPDCVLRGTRLHSVCPMLFDISRFLLTISFIENLVLLYLFNPTFCKKLRD